jgi:hypothetical protein
VASRTASRTPKHQPRWEARRIFMRGFAIQSLWTWKGKTCSRKGLSESGTGLVDDLFEVVEVI